MTSIGVPVKLLHEAQGLIVTAELKTGQMYRGKLSTVEDSLNIQLTDVTCTARDGQVSAMDTVVIRGSHIRFIQVPDNLRHAPMFKTFASRGDKAKGLGMGKARVEVARTTAMRGGKAGLGGGRAARPQ